jgi:hypothetical protein
VAAGTVCDGSVERRRRQQEGSGGDARGGRCSPHGQLVLSGRPKEDEVADCSNGGWRPCPADSFLKFPTPAAASFLKFPAPAACNIKFLVLVACSIKIPAPAACSINGPAAASISRAAGATTKTVLIWVSFQ